MDTRPLWAVAASLVLPCVARAKDLPPWLTERRIIGHNDLEPIEKTSNTEFYERARIVARVESTDGLGFCTAARVGPDLFLTNYHCYDFRPCDDTQFHLGYEKALGIGKQLIFRCKEVLAKNLAYDYALYRVHFVGNVASVGLTNTYELPSLNRLIPDNDPGGTIQHLAVDQSGTITNIKMRLSIDHVRLADLKLFLTSPSGTKVGLSDQLNRDDQGYDLMFSLDRGLSPFKNERAAGDWQLMVQDLTTGEEGTLNSVEFMVTTVDLAAATRSGEEPSEYPYATLSTSALTIGQPLIVASHPRARSKEIDRSDECKLRTIDPELISERQTIRHTCDTEGGSSGSPILDRATGKVVALHWGGVEEYNMAIPIRLIVEDLKISASPEILDELRIEE